MEEKYRRLTADQVEVWLNDPVTKYHLETLGFQAEEIDSSLNAGTYRNPLSNDATCQALDFAYGQKNALVVAQDPTRLLHHYKMIEMKEAENDAAY